MIFKILEKFLSLIKELTLNLNFTVKRDFSRRRQSQHKFEVLGIECVYVKLLAGLTAVNFLSVGGQKQKNL